MLKRAVLLGLVAALIGFCGVEFARVKRVRVAAATREESPPSRVAEVKGASIYIMDDTVTQPVTVLHTVKLRGAVHMETGDMEEWDVIVHPGALVVPYRAWKYGE